MIKRKLFFLFLLSCVLSTVLNAQPNKEINARQIIFNAITAMGGKEYLESIKTLHTNMATEMEGRKVNWITKEMLPNKGAFQIVYNDRIVFQNWYDGKTGFEMVNGEKRKADPAEFKDKAYKKNIFNELDYLDSTLWKIELLGEEKVDKEECYKLKATLANGRVSILHFSKQSFHLLREDKVSEKEKDSFSTTLYSDFKKFGNLTFASTVKFGADGNYQEAKVVNILINQGVEAKDFE